MPLVRRYVQAIVNGEGKQRGASFFFLGNQQVWYDWSKDRVDGGYPLSLSDWRLPGDLAGGFDTALNGEGPRAGKLYFFKGRRYARFDWVKYERSGDGFEGETTGSLADWGLTGDFGERIDAAFNGRGPLEGSAIFTLGDRYVLFDWASDSVAGEPRSLSDFGLEPAFLLARQGGGGVDAVITAPTGTACYFFRGDRYVMYDFGSARSAQHCMGRARSGQIVTCSAGERAAFVADPQSLRAWNGVFEMLCVGVAKTTALLWVESAQRALGAYSAWLGGEGPAHEVNAPLVEQALEVHFRIRREWDVARKRSYLDVIGATYDKVAAALRNSSTNTRFVADDEDPQRDEDGGIPPGYCEAGKGPIYYTSTFLEYGHFCQAAMVNHEPVHLVDPLAVAPEIYEHSAEYATQSPDRAQHCPSAYVSFGQHVCYGEDTRYGVGQPHV